MLTQHVGGVIHLVGISPTGGRLELGHAAGLEVTSLSHSDVLCAGLATAVKGGGSEETDAEA